MKTCKVCGTINSDDAQKCNMCNHDMTEEKSAVSTVESSYPLWMYVALGISLLLLITYTVYSKSTGDYAYAPVIFPLLAAAFAIVSIYWLVLFFHNKKEKGAVISPMTDVQPSEDEEEDDNVVYHSNTLTRALQDRVRRAEHAYRAPVYQADLTCEDALSLLLPDGYGPDRLSARLLLAAMASKRAVILCVKDVKDASCIQTAISSLIAETPSMIQIDNLGVNLYQGGDKRPSEFLCELALARAKGSSIAPVMLSFTSCEGMGEAFGNLLGYLESAYNEGTIRIASANNEEILLPANTRIFFCFTPEQAYNVPSSLLRKCAFVDLKTENNFGVKKEDGTVLSFARLKYLADEAADTHYLSEQTWKKIDELVSYIGQHTAFFVDNKLAVAMERFVGVYMAAGADEMQALDAVLSILLLPGVLATVPELPAEKQFGLSEYMDDRFGLENLPLCTDLLKKFSDA